MQLDKLRLKGENEQPSKQPLSQIVLKDLQKQIITASKSNDVLVNLPTGYGKSMLYQYPMANSNKTTVVFVPLRALLWDAISQAKRLGLTAAEFSENAFELCFSANPPKLLFLTPEKLFLGRGVLDVLEALVEANQIQRFVIDEAHCVCEWGSDFRPHYARLNQLRQRFPQIRILAMTATAPPDMRKQLITGLLLANCKVFYASYNRPNLIYSVLKVEKNEVADKLLEIIGERDGHAGIIYCQTIVLCEELFKKIKQVHKSCQIFHSRVAEKKRQATLVKFQKDEIKIIFATICFGMGINKPNVRFVVHAGASLNCENYYQESGRGGRDGLPADCILLFYTGQQLSLSYLIDQTKVRRLKVMRYRQLDKMLNYAKQTKECRRMTLFRSLGEDFPQEMCQGGCDICQNETRLVNAPREDMTAEWMPILNELSEIYCMPTKKQLLDILKGRQNKKARYFQGLVGRLKKHQDKDILHVLSWLEEEGILVSVPKKAGKWKILAIRVDKRKLKAVGKLLIPMPNKASSKEQKRASWNRFNRYLEQKAGDSNRPKLDLLQKYKSIPVDVDLVAAKIIEPEPYELDLTFLEGQERLLAGDAGEEDTQQPSFTEEELNQEPERGFLAQVEILEEEVKETSQNESFKVYEFKKAINQPSNEEKVPNLKRSVFDNPPKQPEKTPSLAQLDLEAIRKKYAGGSEVPSAENKSNKPKKYDLWK